MERVGKRRGVWAAAIGAAILAVVLFLLCGAFTAHGQESVTLSGEGDTVRLTDTSYTKEQSFAYTARVRFASGNAGGLVFGGSDTGVYAFIVDRGENKVKLLHYERQDADSAWGATEIGTEPFIGLGATEWEANNVKDRVRGVSEFLLRVTYDAETEKFRVYADGIERLRSEENWLIKDYNGFTIDGYEGGKIGYHVFNSSAVFDDVAFGEDVAVYNEAYRPQYHYTHAVHWNNDPNGMVYYNGYYHLFYQHNPYGKTWGDMYWGHARSADLLHWENMPICLFPDERGFMWSGSAYADTQNRSGLFSSEQGGLIAYFTREAGRQEQVLMHSDNEGLTWKKDGIAIADTDNTTGNPAFRDPKIFTINDTTYGILVGGGVYQFFTSTDLKTWKYSSRLPVDAECPDIVRISADDGQERWVITLSGRQYMVGTLAYEDGVVKLYNEQGKELTGGYEGAQNDATLADCGLRPYDNATDAYATQSFSITDPSAKYYGKTIGISWFNSPLIDNASAMAALRDPWNGGFTFPVQYGLHKTDDGYRLSLLPVEELAAWETGDALIDVTEDTAVTATSQNLLADVQAAQADITARIAFGEGAAFGFRVQEGTDGYVEVGYTDADGYYVDRTHAQNGGADIPRYALRYVSNVQADGVASFRILTDANSVEVFAEDGTVPFFAVTFPSQSAVHMSLFTQSDITVQQLTVKAVPSVWGNTKDGPCTVLRLSSDTLYLDGLFTPSRALAAFTDSDERVLWSASPAGIVTVTPDESGHAITVAAVKEGTATLTATCGTVRASATVYVGGDTAPTNIALNADGVRAGAWRLQNGNLVGQAAGDGYLLSQTQAADFNYTVCFSMQSEAAAVLFRADEKLSVYYVANYDRAAHTVKLWRVGEGAEAFNTRDDTQPFEYYAPDENNVKLTVRGEGTRIRVYVNGTLAFDVTDESEDAPAEGYLGLNVFNGTTQFSAVSMWQEKYTATAGQDLAVAIDSASRIRSFANFTQGNAPLYDALYTQNGVSVVLKAAYLASLPAGDYDMRVVTDNGAFAFTVTVQKATPTAVATEITSDMPVVIRVGSGAVTAVALDGTAVDAARYRVLNGQLYIESGVAAAGAHTLSVTVDGDVYEINFTVKAAQKIAPKAPKSKGGLSGGAIAGIVIACVVAAGGGAFCLYWFALRGKGKKGGASQTPDKQGDGNDSKEA